MHISSDNTGDKVKPETKSLPSISFTPKYSVWSNRKGHCEILYILPWGELMESIYKLKKLSSEEHLEEEPNNFLL